IHVVYEHETDQQQATIAKTLGQIGPSAKSAVWPLLNKSSLFPSSETEHAANEALNKILVNNRFRPIIMLSGLIPFIVVLLLAIWSLFLVFRSNERTTRNEKGISLTESVGATAAVLIGGPALWHFRPALS